MFYLYLSADFCWFNNQWILFNFVFLQLALMIDFHSEFHKDRYGILAYIYFILIVMQCFIHLYSVLQLH